MSPSDDPPPPWRHADDPPWLGRVREVFAERLAVRLAAVERARGEAARGEIGAATRQALFKAAHDVAGTAASVGGARLGRAARAVAERVDLRGAPGAVEPTPALSADLTEFDAAARQFLRWAGSPGADADGPDRDGPDAADGP